MKTLQAPSENAVLWPHPWLHSFHLAFWLPPTLQDFPDDGSFGKTILTQAPCPPPPPHLPAGLRILQDTSQTSVTTLCYKYLFIFLPCPYAERDLFLTPLKVCPIWINFLRISVGTLLCFCLFLTFDGFGFWFFSLFLPSGLKYF